MSTALPAGSAPPTPARVSLEEPVLRYLQSCAPRDYSADDIARYLGGRERRDVNRALYALQAAGKALKVDQRNWAYVSGSEYPAPSAIALPVLPPPPTRDAIPPPPPPQSEPTKRVTDPPQGARVADPDPDHESGADDGNGDANDELGRLHIAFRRTIATAAADARFEHKPLYWVLADLARLMSAHEAARRKDHSEIAAALGLRSR